MSLNYTVTLSPDVLAQEVSGEMVLLDMKTEQYLGLNEVGARVWQLLQEKQDLKVVYETLQEEYDVDSDLLKSDLEQLIGDMKNAGIVSIS